jgi:hypothetical protein
VDARSVTEEILKQEGTPAPAAERRVPEGVTR